MQKIKDLIQPGMRFGTLVTLEYVKLERDANYRWKCQCDCGQISFPPPASLHYGKTRSCGCERHPGRKQLAGMRFDRLLVVREVKRPATGRRFWHCVCNCGETTVSDQKGLLTGCIRSCGCLYREKAARMNYKHGMSETDTYNIWCHMLRRCNNKKNSRYPDYGGRGITVCERWHDFENFIADMGERPSKNYSINRIDNDGNYEPGNCNWATLKEQANNTRRNHWIEINGERKTLSQWAVEYGIKASIVLRRLTRGLTPEDALSRPVRQAKSKAQVRRA